MVRLATRRPQQLLNNDHHMPFYPVHPFGTGRIKHEVKQSIPGTPLG